LEFRLLGPLEASRDGVGVDLGPPKQRAVLAALLLAEGRVVSTDRLIGAVWAADPPPRAQSNVQVYVSKLRSLVHTAGSPGTELVRRPPGYALVAPHVDVSDFHRLLGEAVAAVADRRWSAGVAAASAGIGLWRGPLLADLADEPWVAVEAARLDEMYAQCSELWVTALMGRASVGEAISQSDRLIQAHPLRERSWWLRMMALHRAGRSPEALDAYSQFARQLDDQLGLQPGPDLQDLQTAILRHDGSLATWPGEEVRDSERADSAGPAPSGESDGTTNGRTSGGPTSTSTSTSASASTISTRSAIVPIVGRDDEMSAITGALDDVVAGRGGRWLVFTGPAGIGKTRMAAEAVARARRRGFQVVWTSCPDDANTPAWWPLRSVVADLDGDPDAVFVPPAGVDADTVRFAAYDQLSTLVTQESAKRPLLIVVDDAQWIDPSSLRWFGVLATMIERHAVAFVLTVRDGEGSPEFHDLLTTLIRQPSAVLLAVPVLDAQAATMLLNEVTGEQLQASEAFALVRRTGGNPFLLTEYARLPRDDRLAGRLPLAARGLLDLRLHKLADPVLVALRAAAVIGDVFEVDLLIEVLGVSLTEVIDRLDAAASESIIGPAPSGRGYQFTHAMLRDQVLLQLSVVRRQALHARVAEVLGSRTHDSYSIARRAYHLSNAVPIVGPHRVVEACVAAAADAEARWDWEGAAQQWAMALSALDMAAEPDAARRVDLMVARLAALSRAGRRQTVLDAVNEGLIEAAALHQTATIGRLAGALLRAGGGWPWSGWADPEIVRKRLAELAPTVTADPAAHARVLAALAVGNWFGPDPSEPDAQSRQALEIADELDDPDVVADALLARALIYNGIPSHYGETIRLLGRLAELQHEDGATDQVFRDSLLTKPLFYTGDMVGVERHLRSGIIGSDRARLPGPRVQFRWMEATMAQWRGDLTGAAELAATAYERHQSTELNAAEISYAATHLVLSWHRGQLSSRPELIDLAADPAVWRVLLAAETGDREHGQELLDLRLAADTGIDYWFTLAHLTLLGHGAADLGAVGPARVLLTRLEPSTPFIAAFGQTGCVGPVALATGRLRALLGDLDGARADLAVSENLARSGGGRTAELRTRLEQLLLDHPGAVRTAGLTALAAAANDTGMHGIAATATRAAAE
jgi:DNA-binding SARP family transcriptional activator